MNGFPSRKRLALKSRYIDEARLPRITEVACLRLAGVKSRFASSFVSRVGLEKSTARRVSTRCISWPVALISCRLLRSCWSKSDVSAAASENLSLEQLLNPAVVDGVQLAEQQVLPCAHWERLAQVVVSTDQHAKAGVRSVTPKLFSSVAAKLRKRHFQPSSSSSYGLLRLFS